MSDDAHLMPSANQPPYAAYVTIVGVLAVAGVGVVAMLHYGKASDAVAVLGPVTGVISALVAAFFGIRSASLAQQKSNEAAAVAQQQPVTGPVGGDAGRPRVPAG
jgi:hypothetical protein